MHGKMGLRASDTSAVYFNNVRVPRENLLGAEGSGFIQLMKFFDHSRAYVAGHGVGIAQGALDLAVKHVKGRKQFGQPIAAFQATQFKIAEMATRIRASRNLYYEAAWGADRGKLDHGLVAMAKWFSGKTAVSISNSKSRSSNSRWRSITNVPSKTLRFTGWRLIRTLPKSRREIVSIFSINVCRRKVSRERLSK